MDLSKASQQLADLDEESLARLLAAALGPDSEAAREDGSAGHVEAGILARYALELKALSDGERERCAAHLNACAACRQDLELTRAAVLAARPDKPEKQSASEPRSQSAPQRVLTFAPRRPAVGVAQRLALAAGLVLVAGTALFVGFSLESPRHQVLSGEVLDGVKTMTARESILVDHTALHSGARVALEGGDLVAFGEGFSVGQGAGLTVFIREDNNDEASG